MDATGQFFDLRTTDFEGNREALLERVPSTATVGEVVSEGAQAMQLPFTSFFQAVLRGRELNHSDTLDEAGVREDDQIELVPEVSAGARG